MIAWHDQLPSTMDAAHQQAAEGAPHGSAVAARVQSRGRGRRGRAWSGPEGGLWISVIGRPRGPAPECLSLRVGLEVADALERFAPEIALRIKWPNDLYLDGRKLGGILSEAHWEGARTSWVVVGIGINVVNDLPPELASRAVRLAERVPHASPAALAEPVRVAVALACERSGRLEPRELERFAARDWLRGRTLASPLAGIAAGITAEGSLRVESGGAIASVPFGDAMVVA